MTALGNKQIMADNIAYYMKLKGIDRNQLCEDLGFKYSTVSEWLSANKYPRIDSIEKMANYFGISKSKLIEKPEQSKLSGTDKQTNLTSSEEALLSNYRQLNPDGQKKVDDYVGDLVKGGLYPAEEGEEYIIAARTFGKDTSNAIKKIRLKKREGAGSLIDEPDYKV